MSEASSECDPVWVDAEDPLFILYTRYVSIVGHFFLLSLLLSDIFSHSCVATPNSVMGELLFTFLSATPPGLCNVRLH